MSEPSNQSKHSKCEPNAESIPNFNANNNVEVDNNLNAQHSVEVIDGLTLAQPLGTYRVNQDSLALSQFALNSGMLSNIGVVGSKARRFKHRRILDAGSGVGVLALNLAYSLLKQNKDNFSIIALEGYESIYPFLQHNIELNKLSTHIKAVYSDIREYVPRFSVEHQIENKDDYVVSQFDYVVCNPPYRNTVSGYHGANGSYDLFARFHSCGDEIGEAGQSMSLRTVLRFCKSYLRLGGSIFFSYDADLIAEAIHWCKLEGFEPKKIVFRAVNGIDIRLILVEAVYGAGSGVSLTINPI